MGVEKAKFTWITWTDEFDSKIKQRTPADSGRIDVFPLTPIRQQFYRYARTKSDYDLYDKNEADSLKRVLCIPNRLDASKNRKFNLRETHLFYKLKLPFTR